MHSKGTEEMILWYSKLMKSNSYPIICYEIVHLFLISSFFQGRVNDQSIMVKMIWEEGTNSAVAFHTQFVVCLIAFRKVCSQLSHFILSII